MKLMKKGKGERDEGEGMRGQGLKGLKYLFVI